MPDHLVINYRDATCVIVSLPVPNVPDQRVELLDTDMPVTSEWGIFYFSPAEHPHNTLRIEASGPGGTTVVETSLAEILRPHPSS